MIPPSLISFQISSNVTALTYALFSCTCFTCGNVASLCLCLSHKCEPGLKNYDGNENITSNKNINSRYLYCFVIIPIRSTCTMYWPNYPVTEQVEKAFKLGQSMKNLPSCACVLYKTLKLVISYSRCCFVDYGEEMYQKLFLTCIAIVFLIKSSCQ